MITELYGFLGLDWLLQVAGAVEWNKPPSNIRKITKLDDFKTA